jgi:hypothetical protein
MSEKIDFTVQDAEKLLNSLETSVDWTAYNQRSEKERMILGLVILNRTLKGHSLRKIEKELGISRMTVSRYRDKALAAIELPTADAARKLEIERLEALIEAVWPAAVTGDKEAIASYMKISERMGKITGTDRPIEITQTVTEITAAERELQEMLAQAERDAKMAQDALVKDHVEA